MRNNIVVISDLHCGCRLGLCPASGIKFIELIAAFIKRAVLPVWQDDRDSHQDSVWVVLRDGALEGLRDVCLAAATIAVGRAGLVKIEGGTVGAIRGSLGGYPRCMIE